MLHNPKKSNRRRKGIHLWDIEPAKLNEMGPTGGVGVPEADPEYAREQEAADRLEAQKRNPSDLNDAGDPEAQDVGVPGGAGSGGIERDDEDEEENLMGFGLAAALIAFIATLLALAFAASAASPPLHSYSASLSGAKEVPSVPAKVTGSVRLTEAANQSWQYRLSVNSDGEKITAAHLHCGASGKNGPIVVALFSNPKGESVSGALASGNLTNANIAATGAGCQNAIGFPIHNLSDVSTALGKGDIYVNVHSLTYPNGVGRGQLTSG